MSDTDCGCCAGLDVETPARIDNPPGQSAIAYRVGVHGQFKESLLARLSSAELPALAGLGARDDGDFTIALCDALATTLDVLAFYQERITNENYLRTATERRSILELARLVAHCRHGVFHARALAFQPECILYDEPTTMVDPIMGDHLANLMLRLKTQLHLTGVVVTHDLDLMRRVADKVMVLFEGLDAITDSRHREAFVLRYGYKWPIRSHDPNIPTLCRHFKIKERQMNT